VLNIKKLLKDEDAIGGLTCCATTACSCVPTICSFIMDEICGTFFDLGMYVDWILRGFFMK